MLQISAHFCHAMEVVEAVDDSDVPLIQSSWAVAQAAISTGFGFCNFSHGFLQLILTPALMTALPIKYG